jgi:uncharacterized protein (TIGR02145 family)
MKKVVQILSVAAIVLAAVSCGGGKPAKEPSPNLSFSELQQLQQCKSRSEVSVLLSHGWIFSERDVSKSDDQPYGCYSRLPLNYKESSWEFDRHNKPKGTLRWLNYTSIEPALSYDIHDKAHRDSIIADIKTQGYKLIYNGNEGNLRFRNDTYEVSFKTQFSVSSADFMGAGGYNYWVFFIYNYLQNGEKGLQSNSQSLSPTEDEGVVVNGVRWATRNVDAPGTFAVSPESAGMLYQWNKRLGWKKDDAGDLVNSNGGIKWKKGRAESKKWTAANDPSPEGWRIPTKKELEKLLDVERVKCEWTDMNFLRGKQFTDKKTGASIFLPAAGYIIDWGSYEYFGSEVNYWSNETEEYGNGGYYLHGRPSSYSKSGGMAIRYHDYGYAVRPVKK